MKWPLALALGLVAMPTSAETRAGPATVIDGDTLEVDGRRIRLFGIDAPELSQSCDRDGERWACGQASADELQGMIGAYPLSCTGDEEDTFGRLVAVCTVSGIDVGRQMVADGWATAFRRYSDKYIAEETRARARRLGLWTSHFTPPEDVRNAQNAAEPEQPRSSARAAVAARSASACRIKGNRNRRGEWIYHLPGMPYYDETRAEEMFCTEAQARAAGYRRSRAR